MDWFKTDDVTILLAVGFVAVYALSKYLKPQSVHPLLLGRQADVDRVRLPGESAIYRSYVTGIMGRLPERPGSEVRLLTDLVRDSFKTPRTLWSTTTTIEQLKERVEALGAGLHLVAGLTPRESTALILLDDSLEFLITDLALASNSIISFTLTSPSLLIPVLEKHTPTAIIIDEHFLEHILEHVADLRQLTHHTIIVLGGATGSSASNAQKLGVQILRWEDLEAQGRTVEKPSVPPPEPNDIFSVSFFADLNGELRGTQLSHANVTAGVIAFRPLFPQAVHLSPSDAVFSVHSIGSAFGRAIAYSALYEGANFDSLPPTPSDEEAAKMSTGSRLLTACQSSTLSPTLLFLTPDHLKPLTNSILETARSNPLFRLAWRHKLSDIQEGFGSNSTFWDNFALKGPRTKHLGKLGGSLREIVISEGRLEATGLEAARVAFSIPIVSAHTHPFVCGPVMASHPLDLQSFSEDSEPHITLTHVGPPACNVEVKLVGVLDTSVEKGGDPAGDLLVRGPSVGRPLPAALGPDPEGWVSTGEKARVQSNGTFKV